MASENNVQETYVPPPAPPNVGNIDYRPEPKKKNGCKKYIFGIFSTRELSSSGSRESYITFAVIELLIYTLYLANVSLLIFTELSSTAYYYNSVLKDFYVSYTFKYSSNVRDLWYVLNADQNRQFHEDLLLSGIYWENRYDTGAYGTPIQRSEEDKKFGVLYETQLLGVPQLRQKRVLPLEECLLKKYSDDYPTLVDRTCYPHYSEGDEDQGDKDKHWAEYDSVSPEIQKAWVYNPGDSRKHLGLLTNYGSGGAVMNLGRTKNSSRIILKHLLQNLWVQRSTRALFLDFTVYNGNLNLFCVVRLTWEFAPTGGVVTSNSIKIIKLIRYTSWQEKYVLFTSEMIFVIFTIYYFLQEIIELCKLGKKYFCDFWSYIDIIILVISFSAIGFKIYEDIVIREILLELSENQNKFYNFQPIAYWNTQFNRALAIGMFIIWIKVCKYIGFNQTMNQFSNTIERCAKDMLAFAIFLFFIFFGFAQSGHLLFGQDNTKFGTLGKSCFALFSIIIGDFSFENIEETDRILGPLFFFAFVLFVLFILANMFIAIIGDAYQDVKTEIQSSANQVEVMDYLKTRVKTYKEKKNKGKLRKSKKGQTLVHEHDDNENKITLKEIIALLKQSNFSIMEIEMFLARFDLDQRRGLETEEASYVLQDLQTATFGKEDNEFLKARSASELTDHPLSEEKQIVNEEAYFGLQRHIQEMDETFTSSLKTLKESLNKLK